MILMIDNYDSFVYNLVRYVEELGYAICTRRNDQITLDEIRALNPTHILISPGPCSPKEAGISNAVIQTFAETIPILGICLGHQCIGHVFGGTVQRAREPIHGKVHAVYHHQDGIFKDIPTPFNVTRYHSLIVARETLPTCLEVTAETAEGEIMGLRHKVFPLAGVQFHPEAELTQFGHQVLENFLVTSRPNVSA